MTGYEPRFDIDLPVGEKAERKIGHLFGELLDGHRVHLECKHSRYGDDWMYLELQSNPGGRGWRDSGLNVTEAELWAHSFADTGAVLILPTRLLHELVHQTDIGKPKAETDGDCPTEGRLVRVASVLNFARDHAGPRWREDIRHEH